jgi:hypothetical protein
MMKMRRALMVSPVLLASGCVDRPWTPAVSVAYWGQSPDAAVLQLPARADALRRWQLSPGDAWSPYAKYTLLTALDVVPETAELPDPTRLEEVGRASFAGQQLALNGIPPYTLFVVDLRGAASVAFGVALSRTSQEPVSLVPTFNNWPGDDELIPAEETLAALAMMWPRPPAAQQDVSTPVFLLDAWRLAYRFDDPGDETYDNRYILTAGDLPDVETLRARGIEQVVYVVGSRDTTRFEEDDMNAPFLEWQRNGIPIAMLDLDRLERPILPGDWGQVFVDDALIVQRRVTLLDEPGFYILARGGFGGVYAHPSPLYHGGWHGGWHGGGG